MLYLGCNKVVGYNMIQQGTTIRATRCIKAASSNQLCQILLHERRPANMGRMKCEQVIEGMKRGRRARGEGCRW
jgi:hypothetical protein